MLLQLSDGEEMKAMAHEVRAVQMIHTWAARPPEEGVENARDDE